MYLLVALVVVRPVAIVVNNIVFVIVKTYKLCENVSYYNTDNAVDII